MGKAQRLSQSDLRGFKVACWDIEASGLAATFGGLYCATIKVDGQRPKTFRIDRSASYKEEPWDDRELAIRLRDEIEKCQVLVGYNSINYDLPFLNSRLIAHGERVVGPAVKHVDLLRVVRFRMRLHSNTLESLLQHIGAHNRKTKLEPELWRKAAAGHRYSMNQIVKHNIADVVSLEEAFYQLIPFLDIKFYLVR